MRHNMTAAATFVDVRRLAEAVRHHGAALGMADAQLFELELALVEAANNIVAHGDQEPPAGAIALYLEDPAQCRGAVVIELHAAGKPVAIMLPAPEAMPDSRAERGRGLLLIRACVDEFAYERRDGINVWRLKKHLP